MYLCCFPSALAPGRRFRFSTLNIGNLSANSKHAYYEHRTSDRAPFGIDMVRLRLRSGRLASGLVLAVMLTACVREDETAMRERMDQWFSLGETLHFEASQDCAAGLFRLVDNSIGSAMPVVGSVEEMFWTLPRRGVAARLSARATRPVRAKAVLIAPTPAASLITSRR